MNIVEYLGYAQKRYVAMQRRYKMVSIWNYYRRHHKLQLVYVPRFRESIFIKNFIVGFNPHPVNRRMEQKNKDFLQKLYIFMQLSMCAAIPKMCAPPSITTQA